jgi:type I restriction enzyme R subunit
MKLLLDIAQETVEAKKRLDSTEDQQQGKAALTELFREVRSDTIPVIIERIVNDIDAIVRLVCFPFDRAHSYIAQYY